MKTQIPSAKRLIEELFKTLLSDQPNVHSIQNGAWQKEYRIAPMKGFFDLHLGLGYAYNTGESDDAIFTLGLYCFEDDVRLNRNPLVTICARPSASASASDLDRDDLMLEMNFTGSNSLSWSSSNLAAVERMMEEFRKATLPYLDSHILL